MKISKLFILILLFLLTNNVDIRAQATKPFVLGVIDEMHSTTLNESRVLNIYLPEGYNSKDTVHYPVIYLLDGSADEDFIHVTGLVQYYSFEWIHQIEKSIVIGISTVDRKRDFTFPSSVSNEKKSFPTSGGSEKFITFIEKDLQPYIEKSYKTNKNRTLIGQSLGGLLATEVLFKKPNLFNKYIIVSPSLWWDNGSLLNRDIVPLKNTDIYIGVGKEGLTPSDPPRVMEVDANVLAEKIQKLSNQNVHLFFDYLPEENHATIMHQAVSNAIKILYKIDSEKY